MNKHSSLFRPAVSDGQVFYKTSTSSRRRCRDAPCSSSVGSTLRAMPGCWKWKFIQATLKEVEGTVQWTSCYQLVYISYFWYCKQYLLLYKASYLNEEVNHTEPSPSVSVPCFIATWTARKALKKTYSDPVCPCVLGFQFFKLNFPSLLFLRIF